MGPGRRRDREGIRFRRIRGRHRLRRPTRLPGREGQPPSGHRRALQPSARGAEHPQRRRDHGQGPGAGRRGGHRRVTYERGVHEVADGVFAYLQPDGSWGWSNAGLVVSGGRSLLVDTLFDLKLTREMLDQLAPIAGRIETVVNTHANGDHCWGNELVGDARIVASKECADEIGAPPPETLAALAKDAPSMSVLGEFLARIFGPFDFEGITLRKPDETFEGELT